MGYAVRQMRYCPPGCLRAVIRIFACRAALLQQARLGDRNESPMDSALIAAVYPVRKLGGSGIFLSIFMRGYFAG